MFLFSRADACALRMQSLCHCRHFDATLTFGQRQIRLGLAQGTQLKNFALNDILTLCGTCTAYKFKQILCQHRRCVSTNGADSDGGVLGDGCPCSPFYRRACRWAMLGELKPKGPKGRVGKGMLS